MVATSAGPAHVRLADVPLLTDEGDLSSEATSVLKQVFLRFVGSHGGVCHDKDADADKGKPSEAASATEPSKESGTSKTEGNLETGKEIDETNDLLSGMALSDEQLDDFARAVNAGKVMSTEEKDELKEFFDVDERGYLTFAGFCEMYQMQTSSDEDETWKDLAALGYNRQLKRSQEE